eukprot:scaffold59478_cov70-Attheya_sp.AAC.2
MAILESTVFDTVHMSVLPGSEGCIIFDYALIHNEFRFSVFPKENEDGIFWESSHIHRKKIVTAVAGWSLAKNAYAVSRA